MTVIRLHILLTAVLASVAAAIIFVRAVGL